ncbi:hypothetical protein AB0H32_34240, partial [Streptomyces sp. NPDC020362]
IMSTTSGKALIPGCSRGRGTSRGGRFLPQSPAGSDLVVLDRDPFAGPVEAIAETGVALTYVGGERVYAAANA